MEYPVNQIKQLQLRLDRLSSSFQGEALSLYEDLLRTENISKFNLQVNNLSREFKRRTRYTYEKAFNTICRTYNINYTKAFRSKIIGSFVFYLSGAINSLTSLFRASYSRFKLHERERIFRQQFTEERKQVIAAVEKHMLKSNDLLITAGKRRFKFSNYMKLIARTETSKSFNLAILADSRKRGAIGIQISAHKGIYFCRQYEGNRYYFDKKPFIKNIPEGIPPYHVNCKHFIIPLFK